MTDFNRQLLELTENMKKSISKSKKKRGQGKKAPVPAAPATEKCMQSSETKIINFQLELTKLVDQQKAETGIEWTEQRKIRIEEQDKLIEAIEEDVKEADGRVVSLRSQESARSEMEVEIQAKIQQMRDFLSELMELNKKEKEINRKVDVIIEIITDWTDIHDTFFALVGTIDVLKSSKESKETVELNAIMKKKAQAIIKIHKEIDEKVKIILESIDSLLDLVVFGNETANRVNLHLTFDRVKNISFWTLEHGDISFSITHLKSAVQDISESLNAIPLNELRPVVSVLSRLIEEANHLKRS